jgi:pyruvate/2-oxoglutarate dehydrogenase complex dihydrolipoamide acyltransferase (E2) component
MGYRKDRNITKEVPHYRRMLIYLTPDRDAASLFTTQTFDLSKTLPWIDEYNETAEHKLTLLQLFVLAVGRAIAETPRINRYVSGKRIYQRDGTYISVSTKKKLVDTAKVVLLKVPIEPGMQVEEMQKSWHSLLGEGRSGKDIHQEKETKLFLRLPGFMLSLAIKLVRWLDARHWLPGFMTDPDPMYTSCVMANLGSVGLAAGYHHLYEYGNCPFFTVIGRVRQDPVAIDGEIEIRPRVDMKITFDERVEDGLTAGLGLAKVKDYIEDPETIRSGATNWEGKPPQNLG